MKIVVIMGSPTNNAGYTQKSVEALQAAIARRGTTSFEYIYLGETALAPCQGHLTCVKYGEAQCPVKPQLNPIFAKMESADAVIFVSPVHCFNVSALMKNFIDLQVFRMHRPTFFEKKAIVVATAAGAGQRPVLKYMKKTVSTWGFNVVGQLGTHAGLFDEAKYQNRLIPACDRVASQLFHAFEQDSLPSPGVAQLINFRVWRSVVRRTHQASPFDWKYWQETGWLNQDYYYRTRVGFIANAIAGFIERMIERSIKNVSVKPID